MYKVYGKGNNFIFMFYWMTHKVLLLDKILVKYFQDKGLNYEKNRYWPISIFSLVLGPKTQGVTSSILYGFSSAFCKHLKLYFYYHREKNFNDDGQMCQQMFDTHDTCLHSVIPNCGLLLHLLMLICLTFHHHAYLNQTQVVGNDSYPRTLQRLSQLSYPSLTLSKALSE